MYRSRYRFFQEGVHGCSENSHLHDPGPWDGGFRRPLALTSTVGGTCVHVSILMAGRFPPSPAGSGALSLVCGSVHLHWKRHTGAHRCAEIPRQRGTLSMGSQSDVSCCSFDSNRASHPLSLFPACRICSAGVGSGSSVRGLRRGTLAAPPIWGEL